MADVNKASDLMMIRLGECWRDLARPLHVIDVRALSIADYDQM